MRKILTLALAAALFSVAFTDTAQADTVTYQETVPLTWHFNIHEKRMDLQKFDPALGTLTGVEVELITSNTWKYNTIYDGGLPAGNGEYSICGEWDGRAGPLPFWVSPRVYEGETFAFAPLLVNDYVYHAPETVPAGTQTPSNPTHSVRRSETESEIVTVPSADWGPWTGTGTKPHILTLWRKSPHYWISENVPAQDVTYSLNQCRVGLRLSVTFTYTPAP